MARPLVVLGSEGISALALTFGIELARRPGGRLNLLYVTRTSGWAHLAAAHGVPVNAWTEGHDLGKASEVLAEAAALVDDEVPIHSRVVRRPEPWEVLIAEAVVWDEADLVIAERCRARWPFCLIADAPLRRLQRNSSVPVLIVGDGVRSPERAPRIRD